METGDLMSKVDQTVFFRAHAFDSKSVCWVLAIALVMLCSTTSSELPAQQPSTDQSGTVANQDSPATINGVAPTAGNSDQPDVNPTSASQQVPGQSPNGQSANAQSANGQSPGAQSPNGQSANAQSPGAQSPNAQSPNAQSPSSPPEVANDNGGTGVKRQYQLTLAGVEKEWASIDSSSGIDDAVKETLRSIYRQSLEKLKQVELTRKQEAEYREAIISAPQQILEVTREFDELPESEAAANADAQIDAQDLQKR